MLPVVCLQTGVELHLPSDLHTAVLSPFRVKPSSQRYWASDPSVVFQQFTVPLKMTVGGPQSAVAVGFHHNILLHLYSQKYRWYLKLSQCMSFYVIQRIGLNVIHQCFAISYILSNSDHQYKFSNLETAADTWIYHITIQYFVNGLS